MTTTTGAAAGVRHYQRQAIDAICAELGAGGRASAIMACGTGKTLVGLRAAEALVRSGGSVAVFAPTLALLEQLHRSWTTNTHRRLSAMVVCSQDDLLGDTPDDDPVGVPVTTGADEIAAFLTASGNNDMTALFCTYQSAGRLAEATVAIGFSWSLLVADEAHRTAGRRGAGFGIVLSDNMIRAERRLFLTATRRVHTDLSADALSMDDTALYGKRVFTYPFGKAIKDGWLSDYRVAVVVITDTQVHKAILAGAAASIDGNYFDSSRAAAVLSLLHASHAYDLRRVLVFHNTVSASRQFAANVRQLAAATTQHAARPSVYHLDALASAPARRSALEHLAHPDPDGWTIVNNVRVLAEGVDIPSLDCVMFAEPKRSQTDVVQAVGRAIRRNPQRADPAIILVPVYVAPGESPDAVLSGSRYRHVWQVIRALRDHDDMLDAELDHVRRNDYDPSRPPYEPTALPEKIVVTGATVDAKRFITAVTTMLLNATTTTWAEGLHEFRTFRAANGHAQLPTRHVTTSGFPLGQWLSAQRQAYRWHRLTPQQIAEMEQAGFDWGQRSRQWRTYLVRYTRYTTALGYTPPIAHLTRLDPPLLQWILSVQDRAIKGLLSPSEKDDLAAAGIPWSGLTKQALLRDYTPDMDKAIAKYFAAARRHGAKRAEKGTIVIGSSTDTATGQRRTHKLQAGWVAGFLRTAARFGALDDATLTQAHGAGVQLPEPEPPIVDPDGDPDWQTILLRETAKLTQTARLDGGQRQSSANAKATPRHNHLPQLCEVEHAPRWTVTGPTVAEIGMTLTRRTDTHPTFGTIDVYATELINDPAADADNDVEYVVSPDNTVYKRAVGSADWSPAGKLIHHVDEILLPRWSPADETLTLTVATALDEAAQDELFPLITAHVLRTQSELVTKIVRDIFSVRRAGIVDTPDDYQAALIRAKRANRRALTPGPEFVAAINTALLKAFQIAATSTAEQTRNTLAQSDSGISAGE